LLRAEVILPLPDSQPAIDFLGEVNQSLGHFHRVRKASFKTAQWLGQPFKLARGAGPNV
jgi:hypothetical protein